MVDDDAEQILIRLGRRVAELRAASGRTQEALAEELDVSAAYLQRVEAGTENLTVRSLVRLAVHLGVALEALFEAPAETTRRTGRPRRRTGP